MRNYGNDRGFSLVELIVVVSIIAILVVALGFQYDGWQRKYKVENEVKSVYLDLLNARVRGLQWARVQRVVFAGNNYRMLSALDDNGTTFSPVWMTSATRLEYPVAWSSIVEFSIRGFASPACTLWFTDRGADSDYDCIAIAQTRLGMGKANAGWSSCAVK